MSRTARMAGQPETGVRERGKDLSGINKVLLQPDSLQRACLKWKLNAIKFGFS